MTNEHLRRTAPATTTTTTTTTTTAVTAIPHVSNKPKVSNNYLSVDFDSDINNNNLQNVSQRKSSLQIVPNNNLGNEHTMLSSSSAAPSINSVNIYDQRDSRVNGRRHLARLIKNESDDMNDSIEFNENSSLVEIVIDDGLNNDSRKLLEGQYTDVFRERKKSVDERRLQKTYDDENNSQVEQNKNY